MRFLNDSNRLRAMGSIRVFDFLKLFENGEGTGTCISNHPHKIPLCQSNHCSTY